MKFKIIERNDGKYIVYKKTSWINGWHDSYFVYKTIEEAKEYIQNKINEYKLNEWQEYNKKHKRVVEIIGW